MQRAWVAQFISALGQARDARELPRATDLDQLAFEITAMLFRSNFAWIMTEDERVLDQARAGVRHVIERASLTAAKGAGGRRKGRS